MDSLDRLAGVFIARLQSDRQQFSTSSAALADSADGAPTIFEDLRFRAHRLKGAAAIFEFPELAMAAHALERASAEALRTGATHSDPGVCTALVGLMGLLGDSGTDVPRVISTGTGELRRQPA